MPARASGVLVVIRIDRRAVAGAQRRSAHRRHRITSGFVPASAIPVCCACRGGPADRGHPPNATPKPVTPATLTRPGASSSVGAEKRDGHRRLAAAPGQNPVQASRLLAGARRQSFSVSSKATGVPRSPGRWKCAAPRLAQPYLLAGGGHFQLQARFPLTRRRRGAPLPLNVPVIPPRGPAASASTSCPPSAHHQRGQHRQANSASLMTFIGLPNSMGFFRCMIRSLRCVFMTCLPLRGASFGDRHDLAGIAGAAEVQLRPTTVIVDVRQRRAAAEARG